MGVYRRGNKLWVSYTHNQQRVRRGTGLDDTPANRAIAERQCRAGGAGQALAEGGTLAEVVGLYLDYQQTRVEGKQIAPITYRELRRYMRVLVEEAGTLPVASVGFKHIEPLRNRLAIRWAAKTVNKWLFAVKGFLRWCVAMGYIFEAPAETLKGVRYQKREADPLTRSEVGAILEHLSRDTKHPQYYGIASVAIYTGMRPAEILAMKWEYLDTDTWTYTVVGSMTAGGVASTKTRTTRTIRIIKPLRAVLTAMLALRGDATEYIFTTQYGLPYATMNSVTRYGWRRALAAVGVRYRPIHQCRHTYAVLSIMAQEPIHHIAKQMGHSSIQMIVGTYARWVEGYQHEENSMLEKYLQGVAV